MTSGCVWSQSESATIWRIKADCSKQWAHKQKRLSLQIWFLFAEECGSGWSPNGDGVVLVHCLQTAPNSGPRNIYYRVLVSSSMLLNTCQWPELVVTGIHRPYLFNCCESQITQKHCGLQSKHKQPGMKIYHQSTTSVGSTGQKWI